MLISQQTYRDLKPDNVVMGLRDKHMAHLIDFGCAKMYWNNQLQKDHFNFKTGKPGLRGSARYVCSYTLKV